jgi:hypothetical protein
MEKRAVVQEFKDLAISLINQGVERNFAYLWVQGRADGGHS